MTIAASSLPALFRYPSLAISLQITESAARTKKTTLVTTTAVPFEADSEAIVSFARSFVRSSEIEFSTSRKVDGLKFQISRTAFLGERDS